MDLLITYFYSTFRYIKMLYFRDYSGLLYVPENALYTLEVMRILAVVFAYTDSLSLNLRRV